MLFLDDADITHISKDKHCVTGKYRPEITPYLDTFHAVKGKLNTIIKNHPIAHVTFLFFFEIQYLFVNSIFEERMFLPFT